MCKVVIISADCWIGLSDSHIGYLQIWSTTVRELQQKVVRKRNGKRGFQRKFRPLFIKLQVQSVVKFYTFYLNIYSLKHPEYLQFNHNFHYYNAINKLRLKINSVY